MVFHAINKSIEGLIPELRIFDINIERVQNFNFMGLNINEHMFWKHQIDIVANKLIKFSGVLNKLKRMLPVYILRTLYCSMVQSRLAYGILAWRFECQWFIKIQKRFMRIISVSANNAKRFELLLIKCLFDLKCLKFVYNFKKGNFPCHFLNIRCLQRPSVHAHDTRYASLIDSEPTRTVMAQNCIRHHLVNVLNCTHRCILDKIATHSIQGFTFYVKRYYLNQLSSECHIRQCFVCNKWVQSHNEWFWLIRPGAGCGRPLAVAGCTRPVKVSDLGRPVAVGWSPRLSFITYSLNRTYSQDSLVTKLHVETSC